MELDAAAAKVATTVVLNVFMAASLGASLAGAWLRSSQSPWALLSTNRLRTVALLSVFVSSLAYFALLWLEASTMAEVPVSEAGEAVALVLGATHYGTAWIIGACALLLIAVLAALRWTPERAGAAGLVRLAAFAIYFYSRSIVSHAGAGGDASWAVAADWVHLALASVWFGEVVIAALFTLRAGAGPARPERLDRARYVHALSTTATWALAGIFLTGLFSAWRQLGSPADAIGHPYTSILTAKLALVASAAVLGGWNRFFVMPGMLDELQRTGPAQGRPARRFATILTIEAIILCAALVLAALLSATAPPTAA